jgi:hypothetical protein
MVHDAAARSAARAGRLDAQARKQRLSGRPAAKRDKLLKKQEKTVAARRL